MHHCAREIKGFAAPAAHRASASLVLGSPMSASRSHREEPSMSRSHGAIDMDAPCPIGAILDRIGDRRSMLISRALAEGPLRVTVRERRIDDISQRMLYFSRVRAVAST